MHESDTPSASSSPVNEPTTTEMYSDKGGLYNYRLFPKTDETVAAYFNLPEVSAFLDELVKIPTPITVLDLGSGVGVEAAFLRHLLPNASITSLELSTVGAQFAKKTFDLDQVQATAVRLPFADASFTALHSKDMLVHILDKDTFFSELSRVLQPNGIALIVSSEQAFDSLNQVQWNKSELETLAKSHGLVLEESKSTPMEHDDWYRTKHPRAQLLFRKVVSQA